MRAACEYAGRQGQTVTACETRLSTIVRGMKGVYQRCGEKYLKRYLTKFDLRLERLQDRRCRARPICRDGH